MTYINSWHATSHDLKFVILFDTTILITWHDRNNQLNNQLIKIFKLFKWKLVI